MKGLHLILAMVFAASVVSLTIDAETALGQRGGRGGGGGGGRPSGGGGARPSGGAPSRPSGGGGGARPSGGGVPSAPPSVNRTPSVSTPNVSRPAAPSRPSVQPSPGGGLSARDGPGIMTQPKVSPGNRPAVDVGKRPNIEPKGGLGKGPVDPGFGKKGIEPKGGIGKGLDPGVGQRPAVGDNRPGVGQRPSAGDNRPGAAQRPSVLPGLGAAAGGFIAGKGADALGRRQDVGANRQENIANRSQNLEDRMGQRQDFREQTQDQRQDYMNNRREDWQNWHDDYYHQHDGWYHGAWCDNWGDAWSHMWSEHTAAMVLGTTMWGINRMSYSFGTASYSNPYYTEPLVVDGATISYAEPLAAPPVTTVEPAKGASELPPGVTPEGMKQFEAAQAAFLANDYATALTAVNKALASMPTDAVMHEFRALVLFALGKYRDAATTLHPVLAVGPGWDWTTMISLYPDAEVYTKQLRTLEDHVSMNPDQASSHFVLAYHYITCGHQDRAVVELQEVQRLVPTDSVSAQLLTMMGKGKVKSEPATESQAKIDSGELIGTWIATGGKNASFEMTLGKDKSFSWTYREGKKEQQVKGAYALDGSVLALEPDSGGVMLAELSVPQNGAFTFKTVGAPKTEPALKFQKK